MTKYEIAAIVISCLAFICSIPGGILSITDIKSRKLRISISFEPQHYILTEKNGIYKLNNRYIITNKSSIPFTIKKIQAIYDNHTLEIFKESYNNCVIFENIPIAANDSQSFSLSFTYNKPIEKTFILKIYTSINVIEQKLSLPSSLQYHKESR